MKYLISSSLVLLGTLANAEVTTFLNLRDLQTNATKSIPKKYDDNAKIAFKSELGCGACIRGGYIYCIPGAEGSDPTSWAAANKPTCY